MQLADLLQKAFPGVRISSSGYPVTPLKVCAAGVGGFHPIICPVAEHNAEPLLQSMVAGVIGWVQVAAVVLGLFGEKAFEALNRPLPTWYIEHIKSKKMQFLIGAWRVTLGRPHPPRGRLPPAALSRVHLVQ